MRTKIPSSGSKICGFWLLLFALAGLQVGCTPRVVVRSHPAPGDQGIRYYRPKPYLKVEPAQVAIDKNQSQLVPGLVQVSLEYLPDFSEEYSLEVRSGLGTANVGIKLEDGWNLTEISQDLDSQTDENLKAVASLLSSVGEIVPTASAGPTGSSFTVPAHNVPIGYYESIIGRDSRGNKRLYGFRYVGFVPFSSCPVDIGGSQQVCCGDPHSPIFALVFEQGQMVFRPIDSVPSTPTAGWQGSPHDVPSGGALPATGLVPAEELETMGWDIDDLSIRLRTHLHGRFAGVGEVHVDPRAEGLAIEVHADSTTPAEPLRQLAEQWLSSHFPAVDPRDVRVHIDNPRH